MKNQEQEKQWRNFESHMRLLIQQIIEEPWSPVIEASRDERRLLRLFRTLPEEVQDEFLEEIGKKALLSVCPDIEENEDEVDEQLGNEILRLMPPSYDSFEQAVETFDVTSIIFGSSRGDGEMEEDMTAEAESFNDSGVCDFSPEQLEGYIAAWREKVIAEIEQLAEAKRLNPPPSKRPRPDGSLVRGSASMTTDADAPEESASVTVNDTSTSLKTRYERAAEIVAEALAVTGQVLQVGPLFAGRGGVEKEINRETEDPETQIQIILASHPNQNAVATEITDFLSLQKQMSQEGSLKEDLSGAIMDGMQNLISKAEY